jgi:epsin
MHARRSMFGGCLDLFGCAVWKLPPHRLLSSFDLLRRSSSIVTSNAAVKMDRLETLGTTLSQITMYDIKSAYNQVGHIILHVAPPDLHVVVLISGKKYCP